MIISSLQVSFLATTLSLIHLYEEKRAFLSLYTFTWVKIFTLHWWSFRFAWFFFHFILHSLLMKSFSYHPIQQSLFPHQVFFFLPFIFSLHQPISPDSHNNPHSFIPNTLKLWIVPNRPSTVSHCPCKI